MITILLLTILSLTNYIHSINISKLALDKITLQNNTHKQQSGAVTFKTKCPTCSDTYILDQNFSLAPHKQINLRNKHSKIQDIKLRNTSGYLFFQEQKKYNRNIISIQKDKIPDFPIDLNFYSSIDPHNLRKCIKESPHFSKELPQNVKPMEFLKFLHTFYKKNSFAQNLSLRANIHKKPFRIPPIIHQVWLGNPMPNLYRQWQKTWRKNHPNWRFICWTEELLKKHFPNGLYNQVSFDQAQEQNIYAKMSDIARYEIIYKYGGTYVDSDSICFESLDILHRMYDFYGAIERMSFTLSCGNSFIGAKPYHPTLKKATTCIKEYENKEITVPYWSNKTAKDRRVAHTLMTTGPGLFTKAVYLSFSKTLNTKKHKNNTIDIILPYKYLFPPNNRRKKVSPAGFCYHDYDCPPVKQNFQNHWVNPYPDSVSPDISTPNSSNLKQKILNPNNFENNTQ